MSAHGDARPTPPSILTHENKVSTTHLKRDPGPEAATGSSGVFDVTSVPFRRGVKMDAGRVREHLRRRFQLSPDAEASLDGEGFAGPGEALSRARAEVPGGQVPGSGRFQGLPAAPPSQQGPGFVSQGTKYVGYLVQ